MNISGRYT